MMNTDWLNKILETKHRLYRLALRLLNNSQEAEDAVQETIIKIWKKMQAGDPIQHPEAMAMTITKNYCLDQLKSRRWNESSLDQSIYSSEITSANAADQLMLKETENTIDQILNHLPEQQKIIFHLRETEALDFDEIEAITGMNKNAIRVNLSRARKHIRLQLQNIYDYADQRN